MDSSDNFSVRSSRWSVQIQDFPWSPDFNGDFMEFGEAG